MGTRHLIVVVNEGQVKVAQYGQWDGYPAGQGHDVCDFIVNKLDINKLKTALSKCRFISDEEAEAKWEAEGANISSGLVSMDIAAKVKAKFPELSRDTGAEILGLVQSGKARELVNNIDFAADSLFCEWAYVLDLDKQVLEIYKGFNERPLSKKDRFYGMENKDEHKNKDYQPVRIWKKFKFADLKTDTVAELRFR
jgi:hypothetical protein